MLKEQEKLDGVRERMQYIVNALQSVKTLRMQVIRRDWSYKTPQSVQYVLDPLKELKNVKEVVRVYGLPTIPGKGMLDNRGKVMWFLNRCSFKTSDKGFIFRCVASIVDELSLSLCKSE